ncbi:Ribosomal RNA small subunit methyltransferase E [Rubripirellula amarantea]|uniref:Ribosomal RNA small subunit methyltransferase E n=1 Tax=Rubripirellula amarantea TaxID=2527999 RepID=A0A5C5WJV6_9BACT|nr:RsmE family RNA methyltransferase [Rubripirellula amarantea]TWT50395.1 Ribosomal RNA small subunit methyltransferase E [Rubripirellula amarantea]
MTRRYYVESLPENGGVVNLSKDEAGHAIRVMRVQIGDAIELFDGKGYEAAATIESVTRKECVCISQAKLHVPRMPERVTELAVAMPKPERAKEMVERITELGVSKLIPIIADRTQRAPTESVMSKLERVVIEACKQCGRNTLMQIESPIKSSDYFLQSHDGRLVIAHQGDGALSMRDLLVEPKIVAAVGPEGGWTIEEVELAESRGFQRISLGERIYRIETAATVLST